MEKVLCALSLGLHSVEEIARYARLSKFRVYHVLGELEAPGIVQKRRE